MCGFTSVLSSQNHFNHDSIKDLLWQCNQEMAYRGPDDADVWARDNVALSHVRLSIIGIDNGHQPIFNEDKTMALVCNGEIYNYLDLKSQLIAKGHSFRSNSDSEVILHLYEEYGAEAMAMLDGMFAFCLWDDFRKQMVVARDRFGKKPLYYYRGNKSTVFSSELKTILKFFVRSPIVDYETIRQVQKYLHSISAETTYVKEIYRMPPGSYGVLNEDTWRIFRYYHREIRPTYEGTYDKACKTLRDVFYSAVEKRFQSEVPLAVMLSAGLDSSLIASVAKDLGKEVHVISAGYAGDHSVDERKEAKRLAKDRGLIWNGLELNSNDFANTLPMIVPILDEPVGDPSMFSQWHIYHTAKDMGYKVLISGNGADELFYGYEQHNRDAEGREWIQNQEKYFPANSRKDFIKYLIKSAFSAEIWRNRQKINATFSREALKEVEGLMSQAEIAVEKSDWYRPRQEYFIDKVYNYYRNPWLFNNSYFLADKLAMANSIEVRCPFADHDLVSFVDQLPLNIKFPDKRPKGLLKDAFGDILPDYILNRQKTGFTPPYDFIQGLIRSHENLFFHESVFTLNQLVTDHFLHSFNSAHSEPDSRAIPI